MSFLCRVRCASVLLAVVAACVAAVCAGASPQYTAVLLGPKQANGAYLAASGPKQVGLGNPPAGGSHAFVWSAQAGNYVDLNPDGFFSTIANGGYTAADGSEHQVGIALPFQGPGVERAALWSGTAASYVDLGSGTAIGGYDTPAVGQQVGRDLNGHAMLWSGTAASAVDLTPPGVGAIAYGGYWNGHVARQYGQAGANAVLWSGTAASFIDLNPAGFGLSLVAGGAPAGGGVAEWQVGWGLPTGKNLETDARALLWAGSAASFVDLTPGFASFAEAMATNGISIVGNGGVDGSRHALLWTSPDAADAVDLHELLPPGFYISYATGIDAAGNISGYATDASGVNSEAVVWLVPEPASMLSLAIFAYALVARRRGGR